MSCVICATLTHERREETSPRHLPPERGLFHYVSDCFAFETVVTAPFNWPPERPENRKT